MKNCLKKKKFLNTHKHTHAHMHTHAHGHAHAHAHALTRTHTRTRTHTHTHTHTDTHTHTHTMKRSMMLSKYESLSTPCSCFRQYVINEGCHGTSSNSLLNYDPHTKWKKAKPETTTRISSAMVSKLICQKLYEILNLKDLIQPNPDWCSEANNNNENLNFSWEERLSQWITCKTETSTNIIFPLFSAIFLRWQACIINQATEVQARKN